VQLLLATGGQAVAQPRCRPASAPSSPVPAIRRCRDETADIEKAASGILAGAGYDNNLLCIAEKEVFVVQSVAGRCWTR